MLWVCIDEFVYLIGNLWRVFITKLQCFMRNKFLKNIENSFLKDNNFLADRSFFQTNRSIPLQVSSVFAYGNVKLGNSMLRDFKFLN